MKSLARVAAVLSFLFCFGAGVWILARIDLADKGETVSVALGLYFIGKACFLGPMLLVASSRLEDGGGSRGRAAG